MDLTESLSTKDAKKLAKASVLSTSNDPKKQDRARARQTEVDYKDLVRQLKAKRRKKMKEENELEESPSIIKARGKRNTYMGANASIAGNLEVIGEAIFTNTGFKGDVLSPNGLTILDNGTGDGEDAIVNANVNMSTGISTFSDLTALDTLGIGTQGISDSFQVYGTYAHKFFVNAENQVGVRTNMVYGEGSSKVSLNVSGPLITGAVGVGTTMPRSTSDFQHAANANAQEIHFMMPPKVTLTQRNAFKVRDDDGNWSTGVPKGAMIYNTDDDMMQVYDGTQWQNLWS